MDSNSGSDYAEDEDNLDHARARKKRRVSQDSDLSDAQPTAPVTNGNTIKHISRVKTQANGSTQVKSSTYAKQQDVVKEHAPRRNATSTFGDLNVQPWLVAALSAMAITRPTAIQKGCIPEIIKGRDCIGGSRTGSGKTMAFAIPILQKWSEDPVGIFALILTPTR